MLRFGAAAAIWATIAIGQAGISQDAKVNLQTVNYDGLKEAINKQRGKVVLVDFWGEF